MFLIFLLFEKCQYLVFERYFVKEERESPGEKEGTEYN